MLYLIYTEDAPNVLALRQQNRPAHLARLNQLQQQQRLLLAGPNPIPDTDYFSGSTIIAEFETLDAAQSWAESDPYFLAGVYKKITVKPFKRVF